MHTDHRAVRRVLKALLALFLVLALATALLPYWFPPRLSPQQQSLDAAALYGDAPCQDRVLLVNDPQQSLGLRLQLLAGAQDTLDIAYYGMSMDGTTRQFLAGVLAAADRGVQVRLLVDGFSGGLTHTHPHWARAMGAHPNIQLRLYNPVRPWAPWSINGRMHDKYILADGRLLLLGGRNIGDRYFSSPEYSGALSLDRDVLVYSTASRPWAPGSAAAQVLDYMNSIWNGSAVRSPFETSTRRADTCRQQLRLLAGTLPADAGIPWADVTLPAARVTLLHNDPGPGPKAPAVGHAIQQALAGAQRSVVLQSPYIVPHGQLDRILEQLDRPQLDCTLLTNSLGSTPNLPAFSSYLPARKALAGHRPRLMEYQGPHSLHGKALLIDQCLCLIGSYNLDPRSSHIDTELMLAIDSPALAGQLGASLDHSLEASLQVGPDGAYLPGPVSAAVVSGPKRALVRVLGVLLLPFRCLV